MDFIQYLDDEQIIKLFQKRDETAVKEIAAKYGRYCFVTVYNILEDEHDGEELLITLTKEERITISFQNENFIIYDSSRS